MAKRKTTIEFISEARAIHGDKYDYSLVKYTNNITNIKVICPYHGEFEQRPITHLIGCGCNECGIVKRSNSKRKTVEEFIKEARAIHGDKYDYSLVKYENGDDKVVIICPIHGEFKQTPYNHLIGECYKCGKLKYRDTVSKLPHQFIKEARAIHGDKYDYSLVKYVNAHTAVKIICSDHGEFKQTPNKHLSRKQGCPKCKTSKGESTIRKILEERNIEFDEQKTFNECRYKKELQFDFFLPSYNMLIEYDGEQHYKPIDFFGGDAGLELRRTRDKIKNKWAEKSPYTLVRIKYNEDIEYRLNCLFNQDIQTTTA